MNKTKLTLAIAAIIFAGVATTMIVQRPRFYSHGNAEGAAGRPDQSLTGSVVSSNPESAVPAVQAAGLGRSTSWSASASPSGEPATPPPSKVSVRADQALASVNGVPITLKDLMPVRPEASGEARVLEANMYELLLNRAMDRELAFQAAKVKGARLTETQQQNLARRRSQISTAEPGEFDNLGRSSVNTEFEQRDSEGLMLLHNMAITAGVPSPNVTSEQVQRYFAQHQHEYPVIPEDPAKMREVSDAIDAQIRGELAPIAKAQYEEQFRNFVQQLRSNAQITIPGPT